MCALALVCIASMLANYVTARRNLVTDLDAQAAVLAENVSAPLAFSEPSAALTVLSAMNARVNIDAVCVYDTSGALFASFARPGHACTRTFGAASGMLADALVRDRAVMAGSRRLGDVRIAGNLNLLYAWLRTQSVVIIGAFASGLLVALALTRRIQRSVSAPVLELAATADAISARRDYGLRARQSTDDEVGGLVRSFNAMLDEIEAGNTALTTEIAERRRAERLKDEFLAAVSHELRTPLNAVLGWLQILRTTEPTPARVARALESLERNAQSQAKVIEDLLDVSRIVSGKLHVRFDTVDLRDVVGAAVDVIHTAAAAKSISVVVTPSAAPRLVSGDADRLQQVLVNALANAVKFTASPGRVDVAIGEDATAGMYEVTIADTGCGIAPAFLPFVFDRFRQADGSLTREHGGLGLGLTIVKEVTELHGGSVGIASAGAGQGTTLTIRLPRMAGVPLPAPDVTRTPPPGADERLPPEVRVLIVDDDPDSREIAAAALDLAGAFVTTAASGKEAVSAWAAGDYDALVCDLAMPDVDGFAVLEQIRALDGGRQLTTTAIAVTAHASSDFRKRCLAAGFAAHVAKPYDTRALVGAVADAVHSRRIQSGRPRERADFV